MDARLTESAKMETKEQQSSLIKQCLAALNEVVLGKPDVTATSFAAILSRGSILIEDRPGLGKTTLAKALAKILGLNFQRIQCTNDLLPMDILGRVDWTHKEKPVFVEGPIFASVVILDELNRAPARTQSAFLQAMEEGEITIEGLTKALPRPQVFIATQNPTDHVGTTLLPESELDRFTVGLTMGVPAAKYEKIILKGNVADTLRDLSIQTSAPELKELQLSAEAVKTSETFLDLVVRFLDHARRSGRFLSSRAGRDLVRMSKSFALMEGRDFAIPEDFKRSLLPVTRHRIKNVEELVQNFAFNV